MTLANAITVVRLVCIPFLLMLFFHGPLWLFYGLLAAVLVSDLVDGALARAQRQVTDLGKTLDPLADKALFLSLLGALVVRGDVSMGALIAFAIPQGILLGGALWLRWRMARWVIIEARLVGKAASALLSLGLVIVVLAPGALLVEIGRSVLYGGVALSYGALLDYMLVARRRIERGELRRERGSQL
ncbi:Putative CDP-diacylglycerol--glycerol-3-phosphate 3-phosphatidyl-transferase 2 [bacterium HR07]|uniref:CDP-diacylglycerol--glycerol-3-phosphate 3-phosphatidyltransferase n=2 Tax=Candidatus Bipolaricaulota TaxID=67810 RepID=H5SDL9_9BACT|nr:CDP-diacylglycerol--glycerol-3-phosphate 3-phosphatidyltransferase [uncultured Acetothermia bacterium]BAL60284.1 CDP-diacylglycerol--glycerol-3-phosphate 3-phosphatidyltransferase [Candidatus Acetothermum autotrophicum]GBC76132.1 Putative CDP-diacylglycerol--glycerol-3-phosphate 3-phosphatidyl-transferase 2 [bacterium HR07]